MVDLFDLKHDGRHDVEIMDYHLGVILRKQWDTTGSAGEILNEEF